MDYVIDDKYYFETTCDDSPRGSQGPEASIPVQLTHQEAMNLGKWFLDNNPYLMSYDDDMEYIDQVRAAIVNEGEYSEEESWQFQVIWSSDLVNDCIDYYTENK